MQTPLRITFRGMERSDFLAANIKEKAAKLEVFFGRITGCHVIVEKMIRRHQQGNLYRIIIDLTVPGAEIAVGRTSSLHRAYFDPYVAVRDAFASAQRKLQDYVRRNRVRVRLKERVGALHGRVIRLMYEDGGYGFLETGDRREIYFSGNSVLNRHFYDLKIGDEVRFTEEPGEEGPQASSVELIGREGRHVLGKPA